MKTLIEVTDTDAALDPMYFETARSAADYLEMLLETRLDDSDTETKATIKIVKMSESDFEKLPEL